MNFWHELPSRQKILVIVFMSTLVVAVIQYHQSADQSVNLIGVSGQQDRQVQPSRQDPSTAAPFLPAQPLAARRDPFSVPPSYKIASQPEPQYPAVPSPHVDTTENGTGPVVSASNTSSGLCLTGIVGSGTHKSTIIRYGSDSRSYSIHDKVGPYEIVVIGDDSVTLAGAAGHKVLLLGE